MKNLYLKVRRKPTEVSSITEVVSIWESERQLQRAMDSVDPLLLADGWFFDHETIELEGDKLLDDRPPWKQLRKWAPVFVVYFASGDSHKEIVGVHASRKRAEASAKATNATNALMGFIPPIRGEVVEYLVQKDVI